MEEQQKKTVKEWFTEKKTKVIDFVKGHPDVVLTVVGGLASLAGGCIKLYCQKTEYDNYVYTVTTDDEIFKVPAKQVNTTFMKCSSENISSLEEKEE